MALQISLTSQLEIIIKERLASGLYESALEVVGNALHLLNQYDHIQSAKLESLRKDIAQGLQDEKEGKVMPWDTQDIIHRGKERMKNV